GEPGWHDMGSVEADILIGKVNVFAEAALTGEERNVSWIGGVGFPLTPDIRTVMVVRDYHNIFFSPFAGAFAERADDAANEEGYYIGIEADILKNLHVGAYYDIFRFPELSSYYRLASTGDEAKMYLTWKQSPFLTAELLLQNQYKEEAKKLFDGLGLEYYMPVPFTSNRARLDLIGKVSRMLTLRTRGEIKFVEGEYPDGEERSNGWLFYQQAVLKKGPVAFKARYTEFDTDDYDSAIYVYEDDLPLVFTLKSYYGEGRAFFALLSYDLWKNFELTARYAKTWYDDRDTYSSGNDERDTSAPASYHLGCALRF
ncbi:MAG: helix-hairpin-helix domain-containing protein, partial [Chlorobiales bacterium]|nr:helix-hairpin-helix domain-containing protein [Chlorobiales bacterium]